jgi:methylglutaconyl-CoA hydratase
MSLIRLHHARGITTLTLDSPQNRNALSTQLMRELLAALTEAGDDPQTRVVVLDHTGPVFCSGADLAETAAAASTGEMPANILGDILAAVATCPKPVIAAVRGPARAGGVGLIAAADLAVCAETATFAFSEVRIGVIPALISATVLPRLSPRAAAELFLTGEVFDGSRAATIGLVNLAVEADKIDAVVHSWSASLVRGAPNALAATKKLLAGKPGIADLGDLAVLSLEFFGSAEGREGVMAFREKRDPSWIPATSG